MDQQPPEQIGRQQNGRPQQGNHGHRPPQVVAGQHPHHIGCHQSDEGDHPGGDHHAADDHGHQRHADGHQQPIVDADIHRKIPPHADHGKAVGQQHGSQRQPRRHPQQLVTAA